MKWCLVFCMVLSICHFFVTSTRAYRLETLYHGALYHFYVIHLFFWSTARIHPKIHKVIDCILMYTVLETFYFIFFPFAQLAFFVQCEFTLGSLCLSSPFIQCKFTLGSVWVHSSFKIHWKSRMFRGSYISSL
jgi:hypothetical protein